MATISDTGDSVAVLHVLAYLLARDAMRDGTNPTETLSRLVDAVRGSTVAPSATVEAVAAAAEEHLLRMLRIAEPLIDGGLPADRP